VPSRAARRLVESLQAVPVRIVLGFGEAQELRNAAAQRVGNAVGIVAQHLSVAAQRRMGQRADVVAISGRIGVRHRSVAPLAQGLVQCGVARLHHLHEQVHREVLQV
jgi:hypothetical protein